MTKSLAQEKAKNCYWFSIKVVNIVNDVTNRPITTVDQVNKKVSSGTFYDFIESFKKENANGKIVVGPFSTKQHAKKTQKYFKLSKLSDEKAENYMKSIEIPDKTYYMYMTKPVFDKNSKQVDFVRIPSRIARGSLKEFLEIYYESAFFQNLLIGPFPDYLTAEKSKYVFRKYGELKTKQNEKDAKPTDQLAEMANKWNKKAPEINVVKAIYDNNTISFKITITFPPKYFGKDVLQAVSPGIVQNNNVVLSDGFTFNGTDFQDNNIFISYEKGGKYSYKVTFPYHKGKDVKLVLKSILFTNDCMLECNDIFIDIE